MTVNIEGSARSIPESLDSLKTTPLVMHRIWFDLATAEQWYAVMREARALYNKNWRTQSRVKRRLDRNFSDARPIRIWFEVPDPAFATWVAVKHAVIANPDSTK